MEINGVKEEARGVIEAVGPVPKIELEEEHEDMSFTLLEGQNKLLNDCEKDLGIIKFQIGKLNE